MKPTYKNVTK